MFFKFQPFYKVDNELNFKASHMENISLKYDLSKTKR